MIAWKGLPLAVTLPSSAEKESQKSLQRRHISIPSSTHQTLSPGLAHFFKH